MTDKQKELLDRIEQDLNNLSDMLRAESINNYMGTEQNQTYKPQQLLNRLQQAKNSIEDLKQYVYKW